VSVVEPSPRPCVKIVPTVVVVTFVKVRLVPPSRLPSLLIVAMVPSLLVTVTVTGFGGVAPRLIDMAICKLRPTVALPIVMFGAVTWATTDCKLFGV
jgi:hypothetical protein